MDFSTSEFYQRIQLKKLHTKPTGPRPPNDFKNTAYYMYVTKRFINFTNSNNNN